MAWVRKGQKLSYYRSRKADGRVRRDYYGSGPEAQLAAALDARRRAERRELAEAAQAEQERVRPLEELLGRLDEVMRLLTQAALFAAGYRQHARGVWRKKHEPATE